MTINKRKKARQKILDSLNEKAELSTNKGKLISTSFKLSRKNKKHSGRIYPQIFGSQKILDEEGIFVDYYWDDWENYRDGRRGDLDIKKLRKKHGSFWQDPEEIKEINKKIEKQLMIKKAKKRKNETFK